MKSKNENNSCNNDAKNNNVQTILKEFLSACKELRQQSARIENALKELNKQNNSMVAMLTKYSEKEY